MTESFPHNFEPGAGGGKDEGDKDKKKRRRLPFEATKQPLPRGDTPLKFGKDFSRSKPIDSGKLKEPEKTEPKKESFEESQAYVGVAQDEWVELGHEKAWRQTSTEELAAMAAAEAQAIQHLHGLDVEKFGGDDESDESSDTKKEGEHKLQASKPAEKPITKLEPSPIVNESPELANLPATDTPEASQPVATVGRPSNDEVFRYMAEQATGEDPGWVNFREQAPGMPPVAVDGGGEGLPPFPPTAEGAWDDSGHNPWEAPAGGLAAAAGLSALEAHQKLDSLRHTARETGLAGAVGVLGLGLVLEHFTAKHRDKKLKRQLNKQSGVLNRTNETLQREQFARQATQRKLEGLAAAQHVTGEQLHQVRPELTRPESIEAAASAGVISAAVAAELAARPGHNAGTSAAQPKTEQEVARQLQNNREHGQAIKQNLELRDALNANEATAGTGEQRPPELSDTSAYADTLRRERNHEYLFGEPTGKAAQTRRGAGAERGLLGTHQAADSPARAVVLAAAQQDQKSANRASIAKPVAIGAVILVLAMLLFIAFVR
ncbi:MAG TPA: hypothetical protein VGG13_02690 [Candidatus Saccharimonadales bacterium]|jgi:hypothetical protein